MGETAAGKNQLVALRILRRRWLIVLLSIIIVPAAAVAYSKSQQKLYSATASLLFTDDSNPAPQIQGPNPSVSSDPTRAAATDLELVSLRTVADLTARALGNNMTGAAVAGEVQTSAAGQSNVVAVTATDASPSRAALVATTFAREFIAFRRQSVRAPLLQTRNLIEQTLAKAPAGQRFGRRGVNLSREADQLAELASLQTGNVQLVQPAAVPNSPSSPRTFRNVVTALFLGILLAILAALTAERLDRNIKESDEVEEIFHRPVLGIIPRFAPQAGGQAPQVLRWEAEPFRMLRSTLRYFDTGKDVRSVMVTSAQRGDGKSTITRELALAAAERERVLLIEADLRRPSLRQAWGITSRKGLTNVLSGQTPIKEAIQRLAIRTRGNGSGPFTSEGSLDVLPAGPAPPNPVDLLESSRMTSLLQWAEENYNLVVIDSPPLSIVSDPIPLAKQVSGVLVVTRMRKTNRNVSRRLNHQLEDLGVHFLGVVLNEVPSYDTYYSSYRGYERASEQAAREASEPAREPVS